LNITKVIIPVAGLGTRFLPVTKSIPKAMLPIWNTPSIHYAVKEAVSAGIKEVIIVMSRGQESIIEYFEKPLEMEKKLKNKDVLSEFYEIKKKSSINLVYQDTPLGLGDAILQCKDIIGCEPFGIILPDDLILGQKSIIGEMCKIYLQKRLSVIALKKVPKKLLPNLGVVEAKKITTSIYQISKMVEKPQIINAPSDLAIIGRYILPYEIFNILEKTNSGINGEIQLTDAVSVLNKTKGVLGYEFSEIHFDVGTPGGLLQASIYESLQDKKLYDEIKSLIDF